MTVTLTDGTGVTIALADDIPAKAEVGSPVQFKVLADLRVGDKVVIAKGATVTGAIAEEKKKGAFGLGSKSMTFKLTQVDSMDRKLPVRAEPTKGAFHPVDQSVKKVRSTDLIAAPAGAEYLAYIDGDQTVFVRK